MGFFDYHESPWIMWMTIQWVCFVLFLCIFHLCEFFVTAIWNPSVLDASSFVINHSKAYTIAMLLSCCEFFARLLFFPSVQNKLLAIVGFVLAIMGQITRSLAMITCGESFNHIIQQTKKKNHVLVTNGVYGYLRHPSYFGFFYWSIGTQLMIGNFLNATCFLSASWYFFHRRIPYEESTLLIMYPEEYPIYIKKTIIGIPFINSQVKLD